ncbi:MAG: exodeoxyribonuclease V subunit alpha [Planctomycetes bacterium]|nr:exodeoxyribonuclease V subunit alpha [Planctomycetota bacterium]
MSAIPSIRELFETGYLSSLDYHLAEALERIAGEEDPLIALATAVACRATTNGHVCADLESLVSTSLLDGSGDPIPGASWPDLARWLPALRESRLVTDGDSLSPLVLENDQRLYLGRYWDLQRRLVGEIEARLALPPDSPDEEVLRQGIERVFAPGADEPDWQKAAAVAALRNNFTVISGGPGTGKTTTIVKILVLLFEQALNAGSPPLLIDLLAPTGKAAARLEESVRTAGSGLELPEETRRLIQLAGATLHRRLGYSRRGFGSFRHGKDNPLGSDVVIVDEASMIDLSMMTRLFEAVPRSSRLILIGDEHQLASVEAGAILGDICDSGRRSGWSPSFLEKLEALTGSTYHQASSKEESPLADCIVELQRSYRFDDSSGIGKFARLVRDGEAAKAVECLQAAEHEDISQLTAKEPGGIEESTREIILEAYEGYLKQADPVLRMEAFNSFRILCAHRRGPHGVSNLNRLVETALEGAGLLTREGWWYHGRPILITRNDYQLDLFNGDTGLIVRDEERDGALRAQFIDPEGRIRSFAPARLPPHETAYAMTIHKSQGSEFDRVFVVLPNGPSLILSRELIYTAITRAKKKVILLGDEDTITAGIEKKIERASGLRRALWGEG